MSAQWPECEEFYNLMQQYRHTAVDDFGGTISAYEAVKQWLRSSTELKDVTRIGKALPADAFRPYTEMSVRQYVAIAALQGFLASPNTPAGVDRVALAEAAVQAADDLLRALAK
jgi:hypothetical protein